MVKRQLETPWGVPKKSYFVKSVFFPLSIAKRSTIKAFM